MDIQFLYRLFLSSSGVTTDSRNLQKGQLFFALKGDRFDGNNYAQAAIDAGCVAAIVDDATFASSENKKYLVANALLALQELASYHRRQMRCAVIGLTGSNGKTTSKELIRDVLSTTYKTYATKGNLNNHIGVPLSLLEITSDHDYAIIEMGANAQKEIAFLSSLSLPDFGYITNIGKAHLEGFGGEEGVKKGKKELFDQLRTQGKPVFINTNDALLMDISEGMDRILYGSENHLPLVEYVTQEPFLTFRWKTNNYQSPDVLTQLKGAYNISNVAIAIAIGTHFGVSPEQINIALASYTPENNRSQLKKTDRNELILDAYNANPTSMEHALLSFERSEAKHKICILGDMFELGDSSDREHQAIVELTEKLGLNAIFVGSHFRHPAQAAQKHWFADTETLKAHLTEEPLGGHQILIKGSRGMRLEQIVDIL
ncbi:MAG: UDP-N-acetylmuramoyl-tripeptide--D-alanyl-D-alanine ligase [Cryomorphaceae bacterium]|nr:UDP-N-acetylmuramoyl-tripeptide--D-alanyl-D-alanine ligase [Cryomorphaceae bacterium]